MSETEINVINYPSNKKLTVNYPHHYYQGIVYFGNHNPQTSFCVITKECRKVAQIKYTEIPYIIEKISKNNYYPFKVNYEGFSIQLVKSKATIFIPKAPLKCLGNEYLTEFNNYYNNILLYRLHHGITSDKDTSGHDIIEKELMNQFLKDFKYKANPMNSELYHLIITFNNNDCYELCNCIFKEHLYPIMETIKYLLTDYYLLNPNICLNKPVLEANGIKWENNDDYNSTKNQKNLTSLIIKMLNGSFNGNLLNEEDLHIEDADNSGSS